MTQSALPYLTTAILICTLAIVQATAAAIRPWGNTDDRSVIRCASTSNDLFTSQVDEHAAESVFCRLGCAMTVNPLYPFYAIYADRRICSLKKAEFDVKMKQKRDISDREIGYAEFSLCCLGADGTDFTEQAARMAGFHVNHCWKLEQEAIPAEEVAIL